MDALRAFVFAAGKNDEFEGALNKIGNDLSASNDFEKSRTDINVFLVSLNQQLGIHIPLLTQSGNSIEAVERDNFNNYAKLGEEFYSFAVNSGLFSNGEPQGIAFKNLRIDVAAGPLDKEKLVGDLNTYIQKTNTALVGEGMGRTPSDLFPEYRVALASFVNKSDGDLENKSSYEATFLAVAKAFAQQIEVGREQRLLTVLGNLARNQAFGELFKQTVSAISGHLKDFFEGIEIGDGEDEDIEIGDGDIEIGDPEDPENEDKPDLLAQAMAIIILLLASNNMSDKVSDQATRSQSDSTGFDRSVFAELIRVLSSSKKDENQDRARWDDSENRPQTNRTDRLSPLTTDRPQTREAILPNETEEDRSNELTALNAVAEDRSQSNRNELGEARLQTSQTEVLNKTVGDRSQTSRTALSNRAVKDSSQTRRPVVPNKIAEDRSALFNQTERPHKTVESQPQSLSKGSDQTTDLRDPQSESAK